MTSDAKIRANRRNALRSSGPRTAEGKARSRQNARKHGLSVPLGTDDPEVRELTEVYAQTELGGSGRDMIRSTAKAQCEVVRVQQTRVNIINRQIERMTDDGDQAITSGERIAKAIVAIVPDLEALGRYERRAQSRLRRKLPKLHEE
ncbi:MAG TPA: hypothetical protein VHU22_09005 [Xanthobacteraceae bacterium]|jgi:hypothetical protein|nr:hypothetical protein [Xanthobacteraceae bacterium]